MNIKAPEILLLGCGYTLTLVAKYLKPESLVAVVSSPESAERIRFLAGNIEICDLTQIQSVNKLFQQYPSLQTVVDSTPPPTENPKVIAQNVAQAIKDSNVRKLIYLSSTGVYSAKEAEWIDESSPLTQDYDKGLNRIVCENIYSELDIQVTCLRIAAIYGYARGLGKSIKKMQIPRMGPLERYTNRIHVQDLADIIVRILLLAPEQNLPKSINCTDDLPVNVENLLRYYAQILQFSPNQLSLLLESQNGAGKRLSNQRVSNKLLKDFLNLEFKYPSYQQGCLTEFV